MIAIPYLCSCNYKTVIYRHSAEYGDPRAVRELKKVVNREGFHLSSDEITQCPKCNAALETRDGAPIDLSTRSSALIAALRKISSNAEAIAKIRRAQAELELVMHGVVDGGEKLAGLFAFGSTSLRVWRAILEYAAAADDLADKLKNLSALIKQSAPESNQ